MSKRQVEFIQHFTSAQPILRRYVFAQVPDFHQAEDVLQDIAATLWKKYAHFRVDQDFTRWALGVARGEILHSRRAVVRRRLVFSDEMEEMLVQHVESLRSEFDPRRSALSRCRERLPDKHRQILAMKYDGDASCETISSDLGITANAVRILLCRIRQALAECVERTARTEGDAAA
jgi:RNA polymerase sigma-70 factor (ECF subfamily)